MADSVHLLLLSAIGPINYKPNGKRTLMTELSAETLAPSPEVSAEVPESQDHIADNPTLAGDDSAVAHARDQATRPRLV
jgi:hypothetical protein